MVTHGKFSIYRMTEIADTEDTILTDKIEFDGDAMVPDGRTGIVSFRPIISRTQTQNPAPFLEIARKPDTGFEGVRYAITVLFDESAGRAGAIAKLSEWLQSPNSIRGKFKEGRFGIRNDYRPEFNLLPDNNQGYKIVNFDLTQDLTIQSLFKGVIILELSGTTI